MLLTPAGPGTDGPPLYAVRDGVPAYRGVPLPELARMPFDRVWGLLVDGAASPGLPPAEPYRLPVRTGDVRADVLSALAQLTPVWAYRPLLEIGPEQARDDLARASVMALSFVAQSARGEDVPAVPQREVDLASTVTERFLVRWRGEAEPAAVEALDAFWLAVAELGLSPSTRTVRLAAQVGADAASCLAAGVAVGGAPFGGGGVARGLELLEAAERTGDADAAVADHLDRHGRLPGFGDHLMPVDARGDLLREACLRLGAPRVEVADAVVRAGEAALAERRDEALPRSTPRDPDRAGRDRRANGIFWGAVLLDHIGVPARLFSAVFVCGRTAGWAAHVLDVQRTRFAAG